MKQINPKHLEALMKIKGFLTSCFTMVLIVLLIIPAFSQIQDSGKATRPFMKNRPFAKLNLTETQKSKIQEIRFKQQSQMIDLRANLEKEKLALKELIAKGDISRDAVVAEVNKLNAAKDKIAVARTNGLLNVYDVLTPEQRKMVKDKILSFGMGRHFDGMGMMRYRNFKGHNRSLMMRRGMNWNGGPGAPDGFGNPGYHHGPNQPQAPSGPDNPQDPNNSN
jgi:Spy/CpxP family protein refolding chaperone